MDRQPYSWIRRFKMSILPQLICKFNVIPMKIPARFFIDIDKAVLKLTWKHKGTKVAKAILKKD